MPDTRKHRGPHPHDRELFAPAAWPALQAAVADLAWLLTRGYAETSALKLVGDRYRLLERQRTAVMRSTCSDQRLAARLARRVSAGEVAGQSLDLDGFNVLTTVEAALAGGVILVGRDGCHRDMASMHGNYRKVAETRPALELAGEVLAELGAAICRWLLDSPVSNSGRLSALVRDVAAARGWNWQTELVPDPDRVLVASERIVVSADSAVLDGCGRWFDLASEIVRRRLPEARCVPAAPV